LVPEGGAATNWKIGSSEIMLNRIVLMGKSLRGQDGSEDLQECPRSRVLVQRRIDYWEIAL